MDLDVDLMRIPETDYDAVVSIASAEFQREVRDALAFGAEVLTIEVGKEGVRFSAESDIGTPHVTLKPTTGHHAAEEASDEEDDDEEEENEHEDESKAENDVSGSSEPTRLRGIRADGASVRTVAEAHEAERSRGQLGRGQAQARAKDEGKEQS